MNLFLSILALVGYIILGNMIIFLLGKIFEELNDSVMHSLYVAVWPIVLLIMVVCVFMTPIILFLDWIEYMFSK